MPVALKQPLTPSLSMEGVLNGLSSAILVIDGEGCVVHVNTAAEHLFKGSAGFLVGRRLDSLIPKDSPIFSQIEQVRNDHNVVSEYGLTIETPRIGRLHLNVQANPLSEVPDWVVLSLQERSIADQIDRQLTHRGAARSVTAMAAMLAHEVKNPLSGIRGAAQLLELNAKNDDRTLTILIRDEVDRICALVDRMEIFSDSGPLSREPVNIHQVLDRVRQLSQNGFGRHVRMIERYDPSLPLVFGNRDQLVQVFLNLVKNAAESAPEKGGEIVLSTAYKHGVRFAVPGSNSRVHLPLMVSIQDNGQGIPEDIQNNLFDPFVTTKPTGSGLGLALVAKLIGDHGGVIEFDSEPKRTIFRVMLPMVTEGAPQA